MNFQVASLTTDFCYFPFPPLHAFPQDRPDAEIKKLTKISDSYFLTIDRLLLQLFYPDNSPYCGMFTVTFHGILPDNTSPSASLNHLKIATYRPSS